MAKSAEFILEFEAKQVLVLEPFGPYYEGAIKRLAEQPDLQVVECASLQEMAVLGRQIGVCLMVAHCNGIEEASGFAALLDSCRKLLRERKVRIVITVSRDFVKLLPKFIREGANEVIQQPISPKVLYRKIDRYLNILPSRDKNGKLIPPRPRNPGTAEGLSEEPVITWKQALDLRSDCWMTIEGKTNWVRGAKKWSVSLIGPPPKYGKWAESDPIAEYPVPEPEEPTWEWKPSDLANDPFIADEGAWKFRGEKPEFREGAWTFKAHNPKLVFMSKEENQGAKVEGNHKELTIAENSEHARKASETIEKALQEIPDYLNRAPEDGEEQERYVSRMTVNPLFAALFLAELIQSRKLSPDEIIKRFCAYLTQASWGTLVEIWMITPSGWMNVLEDDLMDMALQQKLEAVTYNKHVHSGDLRGYLIEQDGERLGALVVKGNGFTEDELDAISKMCVGVIFGLKAEAA